jgi:hypothetical protein
VQAFFKNTDMKAGLFEGSGGGDASHPSANDCNLFHKAMLSKYG